MRELLAILVCPLLVGPAGAADGADAYVPDYDRLVADAPALTVDPEVTPASAAYLAVSQHACPTDGYCPLPCDNCLRSRFAGWYVSGEVTVHEPNYANGLFTFDGAGVAGGRLTIGHEKRDGFGFRGRLWASGDEELDAIELAPPNDPTQVDFRASLLEFDWYKRFWVGESNIAVGAGPRRGLLEISTDSSGGRIEGGGAGAFVELWRPFFIGERTTFAFIGRGAFSVLSGDVDVAGSSLDIDTTLRVAEASFGIEMRRHVGRGDFVAAALYEAQSWDANLFEDVVINGAAFRFGYQW